MVGGVVGGGGFGALPPSSSQASLATADGRDAERRVWSLRKPRLHPRRRGAGDGVKMLEAEAELSANSGSKWKVPGGSGRRREEGKEEGTGTRGWRGDGSFSERLPPSDETHAPGQRRDPGGEASARAPPGGLRRRRRRAGPGGARVPPRPARARGGGRGVGGLLPAGLLGARGLPGEAPPEFSPVPAPHLHFRIKQQYLGDRKSVV